MRSGPDPRALTACQFSADELRAAADEAHQQGLPITAHAHGREGIVAALKAGFDGVEHASFLTPRGPEPDPQVIDALAASGTFISTCTPGTVPGIPLPPIIAAIADRAGALMRSLIDGGTRVVIGPDAGIGPHKPHHVLPYAIADMAQFPGNAGALPASTYHAAAACNLADRKGRLAPGFDADIFAVDGNPLTDINAIHRRIALFHRGHACHHQQIVPVSTGRTDSIPARDNPATEPDDLYRPAGATHQAHRRAESAIRSLTLSRVVTLRHNRWLRVPREIRRSVASSASPCQAARSAQIGMICICLQDR